jgi:hypothetical protein
MMMSGRSTWRWVEVGDVEILVGPDYLWNRVRAAMLNIDVALELLENGDIVSATERIKLARSELQVLYASINRYEVSVYMSTSTARRILELARYVDIQFDKLVEHFIRKGVRELESRVVAETGRMPADADPC